MSRHAGVSASSVQRIWSKNDLKPHRLKTFKRDLGGQFVAELDDGTRLPVSRARAQELRRLGV